jgi:hypothetical protein
MAAVASILGGVGQDARCHHDHVRFADVRGRLYELRGAVVARGGPLAAALNAGLWLAARRAPQAASVQRSECWDTGAGAEVFVSPLYRTAAATADIPISP